MKLKVCGMSSTENIREIADLNPDYMGFIFYKKSKRYFNGIIPEIPKTIKKVGVFVDENHINIKEIIKKYQLQAVQLHGQETVNFCQELKRQIPDMIVIKAFLVTENFDFKTLNPYEKVVDYFLFDAKGKAPGGNGVVFNWKLLEKYRLDLSFFLSGGVGLTQLDKIQQIRKTNLPIHALDINSKFETEPGVKDKVKIKQFQNEISTR